jgi:HSP20 family protein
MSEKKTKKTETAEKKTTTPAKPRRRPSSMIEPRRESNIWMEFDRAFDRFRKDFERTLMPYERPFGYGLPSLADIETTIPSIDLEDKGDKFILSAEAPGFKKDEIDINICGNTVEISGVKEMTTDEKKKDYVRKERMSESFYRTLTLPEEIKYEEVSADLKDGVLEVVLPKKSPKQRKKVKIK